MGFISRRVVSGIAATQGVIANWEKSLFFPARTSKKLKKTTRGTEDALPSSSTVESVETLKADVPAACAPLAVAEAPVAAGLAVAALDPPVPVIAAANAPEPVAPVAAVRVLPFPVATYKVAPDPPAPVIAAAIAPAPVADVPEIPSQTLPVATYKLVPVPDLPDVDAFRSIPAGSEDPYEEFLKHMKEGKRPFRKPGISIKDEFDLWFAARTKALSRPARSARA